MGKIVIDQARCKGCGICTKACPFALISLSNQFNNQGYTPALAASSDKCSGCALCAQMCPDVAITVFK